MMARTTALALLACTLAGCQSIDNDRLNVGGQTPPTFIPADQRTGERLTPATGPSLADAERTNWSASVIVVETDGVQHHPRWTKAQPAYVKTHRAAGLHATADSALALDRTSGSEVAEALAAPFHAAGDVVMLIPRMFPHGPGVVRISPAEAYQRGSAADRAEMPASALEPAAMPEPAPVPAPAPAPSESPAP